MQRRSPSIHVCSAASAAVYDTVTINIHSICFHLRSDSSLETKYLFLHYLLRQNVLQRCDETWIFPRPARLSLSLGLCCPWARRLASAVRIRVSLLHKSANRGSLDVCALLDSENNVNLKRSLFLPRASAPFGVSDVDIYLIYLSASSAERTASVTFL